MSELYHDCIMASKWRQKDTQLVDSTNEKRITVRVAPSLYDKVHSAATERNLSINAFIIQALESSVEDNPRQILDDMVRRIKDIESRLKP